MTIFLSITVTLGLLYGGLWWPAVLPILEPRGSGGFGLSLLSLYFGLGLIVICLGGGVVSLFLRDRKRRRLRLYLAAANLLVAIGLACELPVLG